MRFWSLKTAFWILFGGMSFHSYIGGETVFMTYSLLLTLLPFQVVVPPSAYPKAFPRALASEAISPTVEHPA